MTNWTDKFRAAAAGFLRGRNGVDQLNGALLALYVLLVLLRSLLVLFFPYKAVAAAFSLLIFLLALTLLFRVLSRNLRRRQEENRRFLRWWGPRQAALFAAAARRRDRDHRYFRCEACGALCRVPRGLGRIQLTCPKCRHRMGVRS